MPPLAVRRLKWLLIALLLVSACDSSPATVVVDSPDDPDGNLSEQLPDWPVQLTREWTVVAPEVAGVRDTYLGSASLAAIGIPRLKSLLVVKDGAIIMEKYLHGAQQEDLFDVRSVTKSILSTVVGIALHEGRIPDLDAPLGDHMEILMEEMPDENRGVTFRHLLTMSGGWQYNEWGGTSYQEWIASGDTERWLLMQPREADPGERFRYNSAAVHVLGVLTQQFLPSSLMAYADQKLFVPSGILQRQWEMFGSGYPNGGSGIDLTARDLARFGQLYLQDGMSGTRRILPEGWVSEATTPRWDWRSSFGPMDDMSYGYLWWTGDNGGDPVYLAWGWGGQFIYVKPSSRLVVVTTTDFVGVESDPGGESALARSALNLIHEHVVPAVEKGM